MTESRGHNDRIHGNRNYHDEVVNDGSRRIPWRTSRPLTDGYGLPVVRGCSYFTSARGREHRARKWKWVTADAAWNEILCAGASVSVARGCPRVPFRLDNQRNLSSRDSTGKLAATWIDSLPIVWQESVQMISLLFAELLILYIDSLKFCIWSSSSGSKVLRQLVFCFRITDFVYWCLECLYLSFIVWLESIEIISLLFAESLILYTDSLKFCIWSFHRLARKYQDNWPLVLELLILYIDFWNFCI